MPPTESTTIAEELARLKHEYVAAAELAAAAIHEHHEDQARHYGAVYVDTKRRHERLLNEIAGLAS